MPFARYYLQQEGRKRWFATLQAGVEHTISSGSIFDPSFLAGTGVGLDIFITPTVALEGVGVLQIQGNTSAILDLALNLGFQIFLERN